MLISNLEVLTLTPTFLILYILDRKSLVVVFFVEPDWLHEMINCIGNTLMDMASSKLSTDSRGINVTFKAKL